jgi:hypothetical protein
MEKGLETVLRRRRTHERKSLGLDGVRFTGYLSLSEGASKPFSITRVAGGV